MKGSTIEQTLVQPDYSKSINLGDDYDAANESQLCRHDLIEMVQSDWLKAYFRICRTTWTIPAWEVQHLENLLADTYDLTQSIALALRLADLEPSGKWFKQAVHLAQTSTIDQLEQALYEIQAKEPYIVAVLALVHYELFNSFELGSYVVKVEIVRKDGKVFRRFVNP